MTTNNKVFIATSIDGYIADRNGGIEWLESIPEINTVDTGYEAFMHSIEALIMGRKTFETVCSFDIEWPYSKPVYVLSNSLKVIPAEYQDKAYLVNGNLKDILKELHAKGHKRLYVDGGSTIQSFLAEDLIDELIITIIPVILGGGTRLFSDSQEPLEFECFDSKIFLEKVVQNHYRRRK